MFGKKYDPEQIAEKLATIIMPGCAEYLAAYINAVHPNKIEHTRTMLSMYLFPITSTHGFMQTTSNQKLKKALLKAHNIYLDRFRDTDKVVNLGEIIIWRIEQEAFSRALRDRFAESIDPDYFDSHEIKYGKLLTILSEIRSNVSMTDFELGRLHGQGDPKLELLSAFNAMGITFTRQALKIDLNDPKLPPSERDRFQISTGHASVLLGQGFFNVTDFTKSVSI